MEKLDEFILKHRKDMYEYIATLLYTLHDEIEVDESEIDIRLAIDLENNQWQVMYGDASYDQKHYPLCAASSFNCNTKPKHLLETLLNDF